MDLLCTENIRNDYDNENTQNQKQRKHYKPPLTPYSFSSLSSSSLGCSSAPSSSSSSSGYNSIRSNSSNSSNSSSSTLQCTSTCTLCCQNGSNHAQSSSLPTEATACVQGSTPQHSAVVFHGATDVFSTHNDNTDGGANQTEKHPLTSYSYQQQRQQQHEQQPHMNAYTKNLLNRPLDFVNTATRDPIFLTDRCLENALKAEEKRPNVDCSYFKKVQKDITPPMRKIVAEWMMEVCAEEKCQEEVVLLALNYMDRFLSTKSVRKTHLQILAAACLLLASKLREPFCRALSAELLVFYTDNSICKSDLIKWELFVLHRLGWDLSSVTPLDFLELLLIRLPINSAKCPDLNIDKVRQHAQAFVSLAAKEHKFSTYSASTIAASSIAAALSGLNWHLRTGQSLRYLLNLLTDLTSVEQDSLHDCMMKMESTFEEHSRTLQPFLVSVDSQQQQQQQQLEAEHQHHHHHNSTSHHSSSNGGDSSGSTSSTNVMLPNLTQTCKMQANAHKDMQDIKF